MLTTIALTAAVLACKPYTPVSPPIVPLTSACEGADLVRRNHDRIEVSRVVNACTSVQCEGADRVRRANSGWVVSREVNACTVARCEGADRVRRTVESYVLSRETNACTVTRCEGWDSVTRTTGGWEVMRRSGICMPIEEQPVRLTQNDPSVKFGLSYR